MITITGILSKDVPVIWGDIKGYIEAGLGPIETLYQILALIVSRDAQCWVAYDNEKIIAAAVTELPTLGGRKVCNVMTLGGTRFKEWRHGLKMIEHWAKANGCAAMRFENCRKGFASIAQNGTTRLSWSSSSAKAKRRQRWPNSIGFI